MGYSLSLGKGEGKEATVIWDPVGEQLAYCRRKGNKEATHLNVKLNSVPVLLGYPKCAD